MVYSNGDSYIGNWENDKRCGFGTYTVAATGDTYEGLLSRLTYLFICDIFLLRLLAR
jgi:hypothetical protein